VLHPAHHTDLKEAVGHLPTDQEVTTDPGELNRVYLVTRLLPTPQLPGGGDRAPGRGAGMTLWVVVADDQALPGWMRGIIAAAFGCTVARRPALGMRGWR
jgi:hypothetical protein